MIPTITVSWSELDTARQCDLKHQLLYIERWTKDKDVMSALSKGTAWHQAMETHYLVMLERQRNGTRKDERATLLACRDRVMALIETVHLPKSPELADLMEWMYQGYVDHHGSDSHWRILAVEHAAVCRLPTSAGRPSRFNLKMKIDLVVENLLAWGRTSGSRTSKPTMLVVDHKSGANLPKDKDFDLDDQFGLYSWGLRQLGKPVFGQIHNGARTLRLKAEAKVWGNRLEVAHEAGLEPGPLGEVLYEREQELDERFGRISMYRTDRELDVIAVEAYLKIKSRYEQQRQVSRAGVDSPRSTNPDTCTWRCDFLEPCLTGRKIGPLQMREYLQAKEYRQDFDRH